MKPKHLIKLGFKFVKEYNHDEYHTKRYQKGCIMAEITYKDNELLTWDIAIDETPFLEVSFPDLKKLDKILNFRNN